MSGRVVEKYKIDNKKEIYDSLVDSFKMQYGSKRADVVKGAKLMKTQLKGKDPVTKEYLLVLDKIIKEFSKKQSIEELEKEYNDKKFAKLKK